ncbi:MAG: phospholipase D-like domain-containing protein, partial [Thiobacillus sp.]|nr:phospholipase D-like domain-containing protein [Thiobacillus sp.]
MAVRNRWRPFFFGGVELISGNRLRLLQSGADFFPALIAAIDSAQHEVHLETYIFNPDTSAEAVQAALIRAAQRGVLVRLMIDAVGSRLLPADWLDRMRAAGIRLLVYRPLRTGRLSSPHNLRRLHRKLAVIDARIAFIGGMNLLDDFEPVRFAAPRLDFSVEIQGPLLASIHQSVRRLWQLVMLTQLRSGEPATWAEPSWPTDGHVRAAYVVRDNFAHRRDIERVYLVALARARKQVVLASAYFLP